MRTCVILILIIYDHNPKALEVGRGEPPIMWSGEGFHAGRGVYRSEL